MPTFLDESPTSDLGFDLSSFGSVSSGLGAAFEMAVNTAPVRAYGQTQAGKSTSGIAGRDGATFVLAENYQDDDDWISKEESEERLAQYGLTGAINISPEGSRGTYLEDVINAHIAHGEWNRAIQAGSKGWASSGAQLGASIAGSLVDPVNFGMMFVGGGLVNASMRTSMAGSFATRTMARMRFGALEGAAGALLVEPITARANTDMFMEYSALDSLMNIGMGALMGGTFEVGFGSIGDGIRKFRNRSNDISPSSAAIEAEAEMQGNAVREKMDIGEGAAQRGIHPDQAISHLLDAKQMSLLHDRAPFRIANKEYVNAKDLLDNGVDLPPSLKARSYTTGTARKVLMDWIQEQKDTPLINGPLVSSVLESPEIAAALNAKVDIDLRNPFEVEETLGYKPKELKDAAAEIVKDLGDDVSFARVRSKLEEQGYIKKSASRADVERMLSDRAEVYTAKDLAKLQEVIDGRQALRKKHQGSVDALEQLQADQRFMKQIEALNTEKPSWAEMQSRANDVNSPKFRVDYNEKLHMDIDSSKWDATDELNEMIANIRKAEETIGLDVDKGRVIDYEASAKARIDGLTTVLDCVMENTIG